MIPLLRVMMRVQVKKHSHNLEERGGRNNSEGEDLGETSGVDGASVVSTIAYLSKINCLFPFLWVILF